MEQEQSPQCRHRKSLYVLVFVCGAVIGWALGYGVRSRPQLTRPIRPDRATKPCSQPTTWPAKDAAPTTMPARSWAQSLQRPGLPNFHKVSDNLYRGAQPSAEGMKELEKLGIRCVINLRGVHSDQDELEGTSLRYEHIRFNTWNAEDEDVVRFLQIVSEKDRGPFFVHCQHGADRTGTMCAIYRIVFQGWTKEEAIDEMTQGGFRFHRVWKKLLKYIRNLDIEAIRRKANLPLEQ